MLINEQEEVLAFWATFESADDKGQKSSYSAAGIPAEFIQELMSLAESQVPYFSLDVQLTYIAPYEALQLGIPVQWLNTILATDPDNQKILYTLDVPYQNGHANGLKRGDVILAIDGKPVSTFRAVEQLTQKPVVNVTYLRGKAVYDTQIETTQLNGTDIDRVLYWSGMRLHTPHRSALLQRGIEPKGVYSASYQYGSPSERFKLYATNRIVEVDGEPVSSLDDFIALVKDRRHRESITLKLLDLNNKPSVKTMKLDYRYWPFYEMRYENGDWVKVNYPLEL